MSLLHELSGDTDIQDMFADFAVHSAKELHEEYQSPDSYDLLAETYLTLASARNEYAGKAIDLYQELSKQHHSRFSFSRNYRDYSYELARCRKELWDRGLIKPKSLDSGCIRKYFPKAEIIPFPGQVQSSKKIIDGYFYHKENRMRYYLHIWFEGEEPIHPEIHSIEICESSLMNSIDLTVIQLCEEGGFATRPNPSPDEFITITYADTNRTKKRYQRCYG